jgi:hypothetical protein
MTETTMEEVERLNPQFKWNRRKTRRIIKWRAEQLWVGSYAMGCRGHPGIVVTRCYDPRWSVGDLYGADVEIESLVDGNVESCSIFHCAPLSISKEYALERAEYHKTYHALDEAIKYSGFPPEEIKRDYWEYWISKGCLYYVLSDMDGNTIRSQSVMTLEDAQKEIDRLTADWAVKNGISNPRMVDFRTYPAPPTLFEIS